MTLLELCRYLFSNFKPNLCSDCDGDDASPKGHCSLVKNNKWILYPDRMLTLKNLTKIVIRVFVPRNLSRFLPWSESRSEWVSSTFDFQRGKDLGGLIPRTSSKEITVLSWWENVTNLNIICLFTLYGGVTISTLHLWGKYCHCIIVFLLYFFFYKLSDGKWYVFMCFWSF